MKVILLKDVRGCGQANTIVEVADGYAHNFLLPHRYAVAATHDRVKEFEAKRAQHEAAREKTEAELTAKVKSLEGKKITIAARATEKGGLFKAITLADIAKHIRLEHSLEIPEAAIEAGAIKTVGEHNIELHSKHSKATLVVDITAQ